MGEKQREAVTASCRCGAVAFQAEGPPIMAAVCHCASCQAAGAEIESLPGAPPVLDAHGGTPFVLQRKDRVRCLRGGERLEARRLKPESPTRRLVAACCNSPMALEFKGGHWLSLYAGRMGEKAPPMEYRVMTGDRRGDPPDDLPNYASHSGSFMWRLLGAWVAMGFRVPAVKGIPA